jgi:hypothetical protein
LLDARTGVAALDVKRKRIVESRTDEAIEVTDNMRSAVEKAKGIVEQFDFEIYLPLAEDPKPANKRNTSEE